MRLVVVLRSEVVASLLDVDVVLGPACAVVSSL